MVKEEEIVMMTMMIVVMISAKRIHMRVSDQLNKK